MNKFIRKLTKVGRSGIALFLPISWIRGEKLKAGNYVELIEDGKIIIIKPKKIKLQPQKQAKKDNFKIKK